MPYVRLWRYRPAPGRTAEFEAAYGPHGAWASLFRRTAGFEGTELLKPTGGTPDYFTVDRWRTEADWQRFLADHGVDYRDLDRRLSPLCAVDSEVGAFQSG